MNAPTLCFRLGDSHLESPSHPKDRRISSVDASPMLASSSQQHTHCIEQNSTNTSTVHKNPNDDRPKKGRWTKEEDRHLASIIEESGKESFSIVSQRLGTGRTAKQCRDRWNNFLRSGIKKGSWTTDEERLINDLYTTFGPKWAAMAKVLSNRADSDIKNKWNSMQRKKQRMDKTRNQKVIHLRNRTESQTTLQPQKMTEQPVGRCQRQDWNGGKEREQF